MGENDKSVKCENAEEEDYEMFEQDLQKDAKWQRIQQNAFTRWVNQKLKAANKHIDDLECDLSDGLQLISLIEVLTHKKLPKHNQRPTFRSQKLENVSVALKFLDHEGIRIVNIDSSDIVDNKLKLILGLIWTLILHYSISMPMWDGKESQGTGKRIFSRQKLIIWFQSKLPDLEINNFTTDWNDGRAVGALVDALAPGLCPDWQDWNPKDAVQNASEAMGLADDWLNIPQLIKPEEIVDPNIDEMSMMTYLSQYLNAKLKSGAPLRPPINRNRVRVYGPGIEPNGPIVGVQANFTVETFSAGKGNVEVTVEDPEGNKIPADVHFNNDKNLTCSVSYTPKLEGPHKIKILFAGREIAKSPYVVNVEAEAGDAGKVTASGPGLQPEGVIVNKPTFFEINTKDAGHGVPEVIILPPQGVKASIPVKLHQTLPNVWRCDYTSPVTGLHSVNIFFAGKLIPGSPCGVNVVLASDAKKCRAYGRGILPNGVRVQDDADFVIVTKGAGEDVPGVKVIGPEEVNHPVNMTKIDDKTYECHYTPIKEGRHVVMITYGGQEIHKSPFEVNVGPYKESAIRVFGPGLYTGIVDYPAKFTVNTSGETGGLGFSIGGPSKAKITCHDIGDGTGDISYLPTAPGRYAIHILCDNEDIPKSPYVANILPKADFDPHKVEVYPSGFQSKSIPCGKPTVFTIDVTKAGQAPLEVAIQDALGREVPVHLDDKHDGTVQCSFTPTSGSQHVIMVNYGGVATKDSPYRMKVEAPLNPAMVKAFGPGLKKGVKTNTATHFNINCRKAGPGDLHVTMINPEGAEIPFQITDNKDGIYIVDYMAPQPGTYLVHLNYGGLKVPQSPIKVNVQPRVDVSKIKVDGLAQSQCVDQSTEFTIDTRGIEKTENDVKKVSCTINNPSGATTDKIIIPEGNGTYLVRYIPFEEGQHSVDILYDNIPIPGSPFTVNVQRFSDPSKCRAYGPGLQKGRVNKINTFTIETKDAGKGGLNLSVEGSNEVKATCKDNYDGSCTVEYITNEPGDYEFSIKFADQHIPGSPFRIPIVSDTDTSKYR